MKTTGIIRRIDDLGRIVIPKELRRNLRIQNGDSLEIFVDLNSIVLKKYSPMESIEESALKYVNSFNQVLKRNVIVCDKEKVIAVSGELRKKYIGKGISEQMMHSMERRDSFVERQKKEFSFVDGITDVGYYSFCSIVSNGDLLGAVIIVSLTYALSESEEQMAVILAKLLENKFICD